MLIPLASVVLLTIGPNVDLICVHRLNDGDALGLAHARLALGSLRVSTLRLNLGAQLDERVVVVSLRNDLYDCVPEVVGKRCVLF